MDLFKVHMLNQKGIEKAERIKMAYEALVMEVSKYTTGDERSKAICMTKLEESCFFAKKAMACDEQNHKKEG